MAGFKRTVGALESEFADESGDEDSSNDVDAEEGGSCTSLNPFLSCEWLSIDIPIAAARKRQKTEDASGGNQETQGDLHYPPQTACSKARLQCQTAMNNPQEACTYIVGQI
jgi:hypothetical protein